MPINANSSYFQRPQYTVTPSPTTSVTTATGAPSAAAQAPQAKAAPASTYEAKAPETTTPSPTESNDTIPTKTGEVTATSLLDLQTTSSGDSTLSKYDLGDFLKWCDDWKTKKKRAHGLKKSVLRGDFESERNDMIRRLESDIRITILDRQYADKQLYEIEKKLQEIKKSNNKEPQDELKELEASKKSIKNEKEKLALLLSGYKAALSGFQNVTWDRL